MKQYSAKNIRNIAIAGHSGRGKSTLTQALLYKSGAAERLVKTEAGTMETTVNPLEWNNTKINILDTPGLFDFEGGVSEAMRAAGTALIVLQAGGGVDVGAEKGVKAAVKNGNSVMFAVTRCDAENTDFYKTFEALKEEYGAKICPVVVPYMTNDAVESYVDFSSGKAFKYAGGKATEVAMPDDDHIEEMKSALAEAVAETDEELMMKFFDGEEFTQEEIFTGLSVGITSGEVYPVFAVSGQTCDAVDILLDALVGFAPAADAKSAEKGLKCDENAPLAAICFKTVADPFVGKMSFFKVVSGKITPDVPAYNAGTGESERMGKIITVRGSKQEDCACIPAGDIGVVTKLAGFKTGDTLCDPKNVVELDGVSFPAPCLRMAVNVVKKGEEEKVANGLRKLMEEDPTIAFSIDEETREQVLAGMGDQHIKNIVAKLKSKFGVEVTLSIPRVAYRETITRKVEVQGRHKKQSGGHGQFGDVWIRFEPCESDDLVFAEEVFGGAVPKNYFPAVEKGLRECVAKGLVAGYPVVGLKATLYDGSYHPVDSSEMAFKTAASLAFKKLNPDAKPAILEPIGNLTVLVPDDNVGDIMSDVTQRRGMVVGQGAADEPKMQKLEAEVPMGEMGDFSTALRQITQGRGSFSLSFARYQQAPANVAEKVIADAAKNAEDE